MSVSNPNINSSFYVSFNIKEMSAPQVERLKLEHSKSSTNIDYSVGKLYIPAGSTISNLGTPAPGATLKTRLMITSSDPNADLQATTATGQVLSFKGELIFSASPGATPISLVNNHSEGVSVEWVVAHEPIA